MAIKRKGIKRYRSITGSLIKKDFFVFELKHIDLDRYVNIRDECVDKFGWPELFKDSANGGWMVFYNTRWFTNYEDETHRLWGLGLLFTIKFFFRREEDAILFRLML